MERLIACVTVGLGLLLAIVGCDTTDRTSAAIEIAEGIAPGRADRAGDWLFWPAAIRVHPLTRVQRSVAPPSIEVRLEFLDDTGEDTRAVGTVVIALECADAEPRELRRKFAIDLLSGNQKHFDPVTMTYRFVIVPDWSRPPADGASITIRSYLFGANGAVPQATERVAW